MSQIKEKIGKFSFVDTAAGQYALHMDWSHSMSQLFDLGGRNWDDDPVSVAGERVVPWGKDNKRNNLGPGILDRKTGLLYGQGPALYRTAIEGNERVQQWVEDEEIQQWLESWDYRGFVRAALVEYTHLNGVFVKYRMGRGVRIGRPWVTSLECLHSADCRLVWPENDSRRLDDVTHVLVGDFDTFRSRTFEKFPVFDKWNPTRSEAAVRYHSMRSFGRNMYALSCFFGSVPWLENANDLPRIIHHLNENMIAAAYVVHAPSQYWKDIQEQVLEVHPDWTEEQVKKEIDKLKDRLTEQIADVMAGKNNAGKFFSCVDFTDDYGHAQSWKKVYRGAGQDFAHRGQQHHERLRAIPCIGQHHHRREERQRQPDALCAEDILRGGHADCRGHRAGGGERCHPHQLPGEERHLPGAVPKGHQQGGQCDGGRQADEPSITK